MWNSVLLSKFAMRLKILMYLNNEDNASMAEVLGCTAGRISLLRCCGTRPTDREVQVLAEHYNVSEKFLIGDTSLALMSIDRVGNQAIVFKERL